VSQLSARERVELFITLQDKIKEIINKTTYDDNDVRKAIFSNCRSFIMSSILSLNVLSAREEDRLPEPLYLEIFGISKEGATTFFNSYGKFTRLSLVTMFQFQIENFLKNVLHEMTGNNPPQGFYNISNSLFNLITISDSQLKQDILYVPAMMRNTYHSNGIHTQPSKTVVVDNENFEFIRGSSPSCASWRHIYKSFNASIDIIDEIISTPEVSNITDRIHVSNWLSKRIK